MECREVIVFSDGDSRLLSTWSNVPYFFTETLMQKGIKVHRVDVSSHNRLARIYKATVLRFYRLLLPKTSFDYSRSRWNQWEIGRKVSAAVKSFPDAQALIFLTFSFGAPKNYPHPVVQFGDWTYRRFFVLLAGRDPDWLERSCIRREDGHIEAADLVFPLFPGSAQFMKASYQNPNIEYIGNVVNNLETVGEADEAVRLKLSAKRILFVGNRKYQAGARQLVEAFSLLKSRISDLQLDVIGMTNDEIGSIPEGVVCHGYLNKSDSAQRAVYYNLIRNARVIINTTPRWGAFSSMVEAMYFYTPIIVTPNEEFQLTFGPQIAFGSYFDQPNTEALATCLESFLTDAGYQAKARAAHEAVKAFTWSSYIDTILERLRACRP